MRGGIRGWEGGSKGRGYMCINLQLSHIVVQQKPTQHCKPIILWITKKLFYWSIVINNVVLISAAKWFINTYIHYFLIFFFIMVYHKVLHIVGFPGGLDSREYIFLGWEDPLEKGMTTHSSILAWRIPWTEEPGRLQSMGSQKVRHNWVTKHIHIHYI